MSIQNNNAFNKRKYQISIIGCGYVGLVTGACLAKMLNDVVIIEIDLNKVEQINNLDLSIYEPGLTDILKDTIGTNLHITNDYSYVENSDIIIIAVGTPQTIDGKPDLSNLISVTKKLGIYLSKNIFENPIIVVKSTVPPGTTEKIVHPLINEITKDKNVICCSNPEFLSEGNAIYDFTHPDRIIIGSNDKFASDTLLNLYSEIACPKIITTPKTAEMIKYVSNSFLATKISFANEIGNICKKLGIDTYDVMNGVGLDHRINNYFLNSGIGFGGSCLPKDLNALINLAQINGETPYLLQSVRTVNDKQVEKILQLLRNHYPDLNNKRIAILGLAFKKDTDDIRESRAIKIIHLLLENGAIPICYDQYAKSNVQNIYPNLCCVDTFEDALISADACLIMNEGYDEKKLKDAFSLMRVPIVIEGRRTFIEKSIENVEGICW